VSEWMPELAPDKVRDVCRLLDADGDGMIDFKEFSSVVGASGDDMKESAAGLLRRREQKAVGQMMNARGGRFGATPTFSYGVQMRELLTSYPGSSHYANDMERHASTVSGQQVRVTVRHSSTVRKQQVHGQTR